MTQKITEPFVKRAVKRYLDAKNYKEIDSRELNEVGPDIVMKRRDNGRYIIIEAKGESNAKSEMENKILNVIGQIVKRYTNRSNYYYGVALPVTWKKRLPKKIGYDALKALHLIIYLVDINGNVEEISVRNYNKAFEVE